MELLNMKAVLRLTGLTPETLRAWERRYGAVRPRRSSSGRRIYTDGEVSRLKLLHDLVERGHAIGGIARRPDRQLAALLGSSRAEPPEGLRFDRRSRRILELLEAMARFELARLRQLLSRARYEMSPMDFVFFLVPQLMNEVGRLIEKGALDIAREHALSELMRWHLREIYNDLEVLDGSAPHAPSMTFGTPEGQLHDFGILLAAIHCRYRGVMTHFLGPNLPAASLARAVRELRSKAAVIGISSLSPEEEKRAPAAFIAELDRLLPGEVSLWLGGSGAGRVPRQLPSGRDVWVFESLDGLELKLSRTIRAR
jgi:MerR family transcriptional regulator, light-induced transcriptional regulator